MATGVDYWQPTEDGGARPCPEEEYLPLVRDFARRHVAGTVVAGCRVVTTFIPWDLRYSREPNEAPALWETLAMSADVGTRNYTSREAALAGHAEVVAQVRALLEGPP